jgi:hypothetical protein
MSAPKLPSIERGCNGKANLGRTYAKQADRMAAKHGKQYGVYHCPHCGGNHLTTKLEKADQYEPLIYTGDICWLVVGQRAILKP